MKLAFGIKGAFYNRRAALEDSNGPAVASQFDADTEAAVRTALAACSDSDSAIRLADLCDKLERGDYSRELQLDALVEFAYLERLER